MIEHFWAGFEKEAVSADWLKRLAKGGYASGTRKHFGKMLEAGKAGDEIAKARHQKALLEHQARAEKVIDKIERRDLVRLKEASMAQSLYAGAKNVMKGIANSNTGKLMQQTGAKAVKSPLGQAVTKDMNKLQGTKPVQTAMNWTKKNPVKAVAGGAAVGYGASKMTSPSQPKYAAKKGDQPEFIQEMIDGAKAKEKELKAKKDDHLKQRDPRMASEWGDSRVPYPY